MSPTPLTEMPSELVVFLVRSTCLSGRASCSTSSFTSSLPASRTRCEMTFCVEICPSPIATNTASALARFSSSATPINASGVSRVAIGRLRLRMARVSSSRPSSMASVRRSLLNHWRILLRAFGLLVKLNQSRDGPADSDFDVSTSTVSPFSSLVSSGTRRPFTRAPMVRWPTSVCTA